MTTATRRSGLIIPRTARAPLTGRGIMLPREYRNLLTNGDIEDLLSGTVNGFVDTFADLNAWGGGTKSVASNVVSLTAGATTAGHSEWWDHAAGSQFRFQKAAGGSPILYLHYVDGNNWVRLLHDGSTFKLQKRIAGAGVVNVATQAGALVDTNWYWFQWTISGTSYTCSVSNDSGPGSIGSAVASIAAQTISDAEVATGIIGAESSGATFVFGGAFSNVCRVVIPAPPGYAVVVNSGVPAFCVSKTNKFSGTYSLSVFSNSTGVDGRWREPVTGLSNGSAYVMSGRVKTSNIVNGGANGAILGAANSTSYVAKTGTNDWTAVSASGTQTGTTANAEVGIQTASGTAWFDLLWLAQQAYDTGQRRYNTIRSGWR